MSTGGGSSAPARGGGAGLSLRRSLTYAVLMGMAFGGYGFAVARSEPWRVVLGALLVGALFGWAAYRLERGPAPVPTAALAALGLGSLALSAWGLLIRQRPEGAEWIPAVLVLCFPVTVLVLALRQWRARE